MEQVDSATVRFLSLKAPRASAKDAQIIEQKMRSGELFKSFSADDRDRLWSNLKLVEYFIPTFDSFFSNASYLGDLSNCVKGLLNLTPTDTLFGALSRRLENKNPGPDQFLIPDFKVRIPISQSDLDTTVESGLSTADHLCNAHLL